MKTSDAALKQASLLVTAPACAVSSKGDVDSTSQR